MSVEQVDLRGLECPVPTLRAVEAVKRVRAEGQAVTVLIDDPVCAEEIPAQAGPLAYSARVEASADGEWTIRLEPVATAATSQASHLEEGAA